MVLRQYFFEIANRWVDKVNVADSQLVLDGAKMDIGVRAHCRRVATWSRELARALGLSESERTLVERAALSHHVPEIVLDDHARIHLLADIGLEESGDQSLLDEDARLILSMFRGRREVSDPSIAKLIAVLEMSDDFDQFFEAHPLFESEPPHSSTHPTF